MSREIPRDFYHCLLVDFPSARERTLCARVLTLTRLGEVKRTPSGRFASFEGHTVIKPLYRHSHDHQLGTVLAGIIESFGGRAYGKVVMNHHARGQLYVERSHGARDFIQAVI